MSPRRRVDPDVESLLVAVRRHVHTQQLLEWIVAAALLSAIFLSSSSSLQLFVSTRSEVIHSVLWRCPAAAQHTDVSAGYVSMAE